MSDWLIGEDGWCRGVRHIASLHYDRRASGSPIDLVVVHSISLPPGCFQTQAVAQFFTGSLDIAADERLRDLAGVRVSSHFFIERNGTVDQFVSCNSRAWHAGVSSFQGRTRCNDFSVGIELEGTDDTAFTESQYASLERLLRAIAQRYAPRWIVGHSDIAPGRKTDPGPFFDWSRLSRRAFLFGSPELPGAAARKSVNFVLNAA